MTQKSFNFAKKFSLPLYFVSAADGTNVVKVMGGCRGSLRRWEAWRFPGCAGEKGWLQGSRRGWHCWGPWKRQEGVVVSVNRRGGW